MNVTFSMVIKGEEHIIHTLRTYFKLMTFSIATSNGTILC